MVDVLLLFGSEKQAAATRLAEAVESTGYTVELREIADPGELAGAVAGTPATGACLLVWSRLLVSAVLAGGLEAIRAQPNLIEVSIDGITPPSRLDPARVVLLSGWRGQPFHPGWQKVQAELRRLCAPSAAPVAAARRSDPGGTSRPARLRLAPAWLGMLAVAALAAAALVWWMGHQTFARPGPPVQRQGPARAASAGRAVQPPRAPAPLPPVPIRAEDAAAAPPPDPAAPAAEKAVDGQAHAAPRPHGPREAPVATRSLEKKKYSARNSKTMRLFCAGAGRGTPQCQVFLRSTRD